MSAIIYSDDDRVPEHLVGTRQGLFHLLRGTSIAPPEDTMAQAELPRVARQANGFRRSNAAQETRHILTSERDRISEFLVKDEFCFHR